MIARLLQIPGADDIELDMLEPVRRKLSNEEQGRWLMIVDNVDDKRVLFDTEINGHSVYEYLPGSRQGMILFTTRNREIAVDLAPNANHPLGEMESGETRELIRRSLQSPHEQGLYSEDAVDRFLTMLSHLPLAIIQSLAFMKKNSTSMEDYVELFEKNPPGQIRTIADRLQ